MDEEFDFSEFEDFEYHDYEDDYQAEYNRLPIAHMIFKNDHFSFEEVTEAFNIELRSVGYSSLREAERFFNSPHIFQRFKHLMEHCIQTGTVQSKDFVAKNSYCSVRFQCEKDPEDDARVKCIAVLFNISKFEPKSNAEDRERALRSLYSIYDYINFVDVNNMIIKRLYTNNSETSVGKSIDYMTYIEDVANTIIHPEEVSKYLEFVDPDNIVKRFENEGKNLIISYFRVLDFRGEYKWRTFIILNPSSSVDGEYISCMRNVDSNTEHILIKNDYVRLFNNLPLAYAVFQLTGTNEDNLERIECLYASNKLASLFKMTEGSINGRDVIAYISRPELSGIKRIVCNAAFKGIEGKDYYYAESLKKWFNIIVNQAVTKGKCAVIFEDVTTEKIRTDKYGLDWRTDDLIIKCTKVLHSGLPHEVAINTLLDTVGKAIGASRLYILEKIDEDIYSETFEWCDESTESSLGIFSRIDDSNSLGWENEYPGAFSLVIEDTESIKNSHPGMYEKFKLLDVKSIIEFPIDEDGQLIGYFGATNYTISKNIDIKQLMESISYFLSSEFSRKRLMHELEKKSVYDALCDVKNRTALEITVKKLKKRDVSVGVVYADANGLKVVNDTQGHEAGDELLKRISAILKDHFNKDYVYRAGGDEFVVLVSNIDSSKFVEACELLKKDYEAAKDLSVAVGWQWGASSNEIDKVMKSADKLMYEDKSNYYKLHNRRRSADR